VPLWPPRLQPRVPLSVLPLELLSLPPLPASPSVLQPRVPLPVLPEPASPELPPPLELLSPEPRSYPLRHRPSYKRGQPTGQS